MYACIRETGCGFFEVVGALNDQDCISSDPPPHNSEIASWQYCLRLSRYLPLSAVYVCSLQEYIVLGNKLQDGGNRPSSAPIGAGYAGSWIWISENSLPGTPVNMGIRKGRDC